MMKDKAINGRFEAASCRRRQEEKAILAIVEENMSDILAGVGEMNDVRNLIHAQNTLHQEKHVDLLT